MNTHFEVGAGAMHATHAILLYSGRYCSVHKVSEKEDGELAMEAGVPASLQALRGLFDGLNPAQAARPEFMDSRILSRGPSWLVWWVRAGHRRVWFDAQGIGKRSAVVPHPALLFAVHPRGWSVFALKTKSRPRRGTKLYQAPYFNVWSSGSICEGSADTPSGDRAADTDAWERAFFDSNFSHPNIQEPGRLVVHKKGPFDLWKRLLNGRYKEFPREVLYPLGTSVDDLFGAIRRELS